MSAVESRERVEFAPVAERPPSDSETRRLSNAQWLALIQATSTGVEWCFAWPQQIGAPLRLLAPDEETVYRVDANGEKYRETFWADGE